MNKKMMKAVAALMLMTAVVFAAGCTKPDDPNNGGNNNGNSGSGNSALANTTWQLNSPNDETYHGDVIYTLAFGQGNEVTFTRDMDFGSTTSTAVMKGTYTYSNGSGVAMIHNVGETTDFRITFTVSGNTLIWHFNLRDITLTKIA